MCGKRGLIDHGHGAFFIFVSDSARVCVSVGRVGMITVLYQRNRFPPKRIQINVPARFWWFWQARHTARRLKIAQTALAPEVVLTRLHELLLLYVVESVAFERVLPVVKHLRYDSRYGIIWYQARHTISVRTTTDCSVLIVTVYFVFAHLKIFTAEICVEAHYFTDKSTRWRGEKISPPPRPTIVSTNAMKKIPKIRITDGVIGHSITIFRTVNESIDFEKKEDTISCCSPSRL